MLAERDIRYAPKTLVTRLDPAAKVAHLADGGTLPYDLFLAVPVHRAPQVVVDAGMTEDGWIAVDPATLATRFEDVYAVGDITSAPVPRAGAIAEGEAATVADVIVAHVRGLAAPAPYQAGRRVTWSSAAPRLARSTSTSSPARDRRPCSAPRRSPLPTRSGSSAPHGGSAGSGTPPETTV